MDEGSGSFLRPMLVIAGVDILATVVALAALAVMTSGGGEGHPVSPAITAVANILLALGLPLAWLGERLLYSQETGAPFVVLIALRLVNALAVGAIGAWIWLFSRRSRRGQHA